MAAQCGSSQQDAYAVAMPLKNPKARRAYERERKRRKRFEAYDILPEPERSRALARLRGTYNINYDNRI